MMLVAWVGSHPATVTFALWFVTSCLAAYFKPKSPEEYLAMKPWKAAMWKLAAAAVSDFPKVIKVAREMAMGAPKKISVEDVATKINEQVHEKDLP